jgi:hypothetical protein
MLSAGKISLGDKTSLVLLSLPVGKKAKRSSTAGCFAEYLLCTDVCARRLCVMSSSTLSRLSGISLIIGGLLAAIGGIGQGVFPNLFSPVWLLVSVFADFGQFFILLGLPILYARQMKRAEMLGLVGFVLFFVATIEVAGGGNLFDMVVYPWVTKLNAFNNPPLSFILFFMILKLLLFVGSLIFGIAQLRAGVFPKGPILLFLVGSVLLGFGGIAHMIHYLDYLGSLLCDLSFVWFGSILLSQSRLQEEVQPGSTPVRADARA